MNEHLEYLIANLIDHYRCEKNQKFWYSAAKMAIAHIFRITNNHNDIPQKKIAFLASRLKNNITPKSIRYFAQECFLEIEKKDLLRKESFPKSPAKNSPKKLIKLAEQEVNNLLIDGRSNEEAIARAANSLLKKDKRHKISPTTASKNHPLSEVINATSSNKIIPKEDIRSKLINLGNNKNHLLNLLSKAQAFSSVRLHRLLGDEMFFYCKPLGFQAANGETVIVEVPTTAHMHLLTYKKLDILRSLRRDSAFINTKNIKFKLQRSDY